MSVNYTVGLIQFVHLILDVHAILCMRLKRKCISFFAQNTLALSIPTVLLAQHQTFMYCVR